MASALRPAAAAAAVGVFSLLYINTYGTSAPSQVIPEKNRAFVFIKPHAALDGVSKLVRASIEAKGIKVNAEGEIGAQDIDEKKLIDQHYYSIASKATILKPDQLNVDNGKFSKHFNENWSDVLAAGRAFNAMDGCKELGVDAAGLNKIWADAKKNGKLCKLGGGFYAGQIENKGKKIYIFNGFFMSMRSGFTAPGKKIHFYDVEFDPKTVAWADFRGKLLGPTDPKDAPADSLRGKIYADWKALGLESQPNVGDNGVHASASRFEAMAELMNWRSVKCSDEAFCTALVRGGIPESMVKDWSVDPQVIINKDGKKGSLFDAVEDMDSKPCYEKLMELYALNKK